MHTVPLNYVALCNRDVSNLLDFTCRNHDLIIRVLDVSVNVYTIQSAGIVPFRSHI